MHDCFETWTYAFYVNFGEKRIPKSQRQRPHSRASYFSIITLETGTDTFLKIAFT